MLAVVYVTLALAMACSAVYAILTPNLIRAAVALGIGSVLLATVFFLLQSPYAGGFEMSVGAGLVSVLFIIAISLTETVERRHETRTSAPGHRGDDPVD